MAKLLKIDKKISPSLATLGATLVIYKLSLPLRIQGALFLVPYVIEYYKDENESEGKKGE